jgi:hypothetical protein
MNPHDNVLTFAAKMVAGFEISSKTWPLCEALLLRSAMTEPRILRILLDIYDTNTNAAPDPGKLARTVDSICVEHAALQHGNEVLWALWAARSHNLHIDARVAKAVSSVDDDLVALSALHLNSEGQVDDLDTSFWQKFISREQLYGQHWLLAYEAPLKGWLVPANGRDYIGADTFFNILNTSGVSFYDSEATHVEDQTEYSDDDSDDLADLAFVRDEDELAEHPL